jgi:hypothetical protein
MARMQNVSTRLALVDVLRNCAAEVERASGTTVRERDGV